MLMNPPPGLGQISSTPGFSPATINRQNIQPMAVPGLQSKPVLGRGTTGLAQGFGGISSNPLSPQLNTSSVVNVLGR